ncbi:MAG: glycine cleavage system protein GcvH [Deltaproteobacteria bacterium]|nr:glycine cleavage system protein GcvH [Deltaproteobacteria bacterium]
MHCPEDLKYTKEHEWVRVKGNVATLGITDYAQDQLGDIVFVELPEEGEDVEKGDTFGVVESTKSVSDLYLPVSGRVIEVNDPLLDSPEIVNEDSYGEGWMIRIEMDDKSELDDLLSAEEYEAFLKEESE